MAGITSFDNFETILDHSVSNMKRIKKELALAEEIDSIDYIGLAIINTKKYREDFVKTLAGVLRDSDLIASGGNGLVYLFLPGTNFAGLMDIISDFKEFYQDAFDYVASAILLKDIKNTGDILSELVGQASAKGWK